MSVGGGFVVPGGALLVLARRQLPLVVLVDSIVGEVELGMRERVGEEGEEGLATACRLLDEA